MNSTECVTDLDEQSKMIIFESILTTLKLAPFFEAAGAVAEIVLSLKPYHHTLKQI